MADRAGQQIGHYRLQRLLGVGGFAEVYLGEHVHLRTLAAIKVLSTRLHSEEIERFRAEAETLAHLKHPSIVKVFDFGVEGGVPYLVMDYAVHGTLRQRHPKGTRLSPTTILPYVRQVASALQYAHEQRLIHRDVKPENMLLGDSDEVLLSDFGIAILSQSSRYQSTQDVGGTLAYMAPEQIQGHPRPASDQYSLGIVLYEWLTGKRPYTGLMGEVVAQHLSTSPPPLREQLPDLSPGLEQVVLTALEKDPKQRFATIRAFAIAFEQACQSDPSFLSPTVRGLLPAQPPLFAEPTLPLESAAETLPKQRRVPPSEQQAALEPPVTDSPGEPPLPDSPRVTSPPPEPTRPPATPAAGLFAMITEPTPDSPSPDSPRAVLPPDSPLAASSTGVRPPGISRRAVVLGLAGLGVVGVVGGGLVWFTQAHSGFSDEFNGSLDPRWMWVDPGGDSTHEVTAQGMLRMSIPTANRDLYPAYNLDAPRLLQPITGDFTLETRLHFNPTFSYQGAGLLVWENATRFLRLNRSYFNFSGFTFEQYGDGNYTRILSADNPGPAVTATVVDLRLQRSGETFTASWRDPSAGQGWQVLGETALHFDTTSVGLLLVAEAQAGNPPNVPTSGDYEYFHVS